MTHPDHETATSAPARATSAVWTLVVTGLSWVVLVVSDHIAFDLRDRTANSSTTGDGEPYLSDPSWPAEGILPWEVGIAVVVGMVCAIAAATLSLAPKLWAVVSAVAALPYVLLLLIVWYTNPLTVTRFHTDAGDLEQDPGPLWYLPVRNGLLLALFLSTVVFVALAVRGYAHGGKTHRSAWTRSMLDATRNAFVQDRRPGLKCVLAAIPVLLIAIYLSDRLALSAQPTTGSRVYTPDGDWHLQPPMWPRAFVLDGELVAAVVIGIGCLAAMATAARWRGRVPTVVAVVASACWCLAVFGWTNSPLLQAEHPGLRSLIIENEPAWHPLARGGAYAALTVCLFIVAIVGATEGSRRSRRSTRWHVDTENGLRKEMNWGHRDTYGEPENPDEGE